VQQSLYIDVALLLSMKRGVTLVLLSLFFLALAPLVSAQTVENSRGSQVYIALVGLLYLATFITHFSRYYFLHTMQRFRSQVVSESWLFTYFLLRDGLLFLTFILGFLLLRADLYSSLQLAVPFLPFAFVLLGVVLYIRLVSNDEDVWAHFWTGLTLFFGLLFYVFPLFVSPESASYGWIVAHFSSLFNPGLTQMSLQLSTFILGVLAVFLFIHHVRHLFISDNGKPKHHPHGLLFKVVCSAFVIIIFLLLFLILLSRLSGSVLWS
jgi:hypothetical protein